MTFMFRVSVQVFWRCSFSLFLTPTALFFSLSLSCILLYALHFVSFALSLLIRSKGCEIGSLTHTLTLTPWSFTGHFCLSCLAFGTSVSHCSSVFSEGNVTNAQYLLPHYCLLRFSRSLFLCCLPLLSPLLLISADLVLLSEGSETRVFRHIVPIPRGILPVIPAPAPVKGSSFAYPTIRPIIAKWDTQGKG